MYSKEIVFKRGVFQISPPDYLQPMSENILHTCFVTHAFKSGKMLYPNVCMKSCTVEVSGERTLGVGNPRACYLKVEGLYRHGGKATHDIRSLDVSTSYTYWEVI